MPLRARRLLARRACELASGLRPVVGEGHRLHAEVHVRHGERVVARERARRRCRRPPDLGAPQSADGPQDSQPMSSPRRGDVVRRQVRPPHAREHRRERHPADLRRGLRTCGERHGEQRRVVGVVAPHEAHVIWVAHAELAQGVHEARAGAVVGPHRPLGGVHLEQAPHLDGLWIGHSIGVGRVHGVISERLRQSCGVVGGPRDERPVGPEVAGGDKKVQVRLPVGPGPMHQQARDDPHGKLALAGQRADGGRDRAGGHAGDLAEAASAMQAVRSEPLRDRKHDLPVRHGRQERGVAPLRPDGEPLRVAAGTGVAAPTRIREQVLVGARMAVEAGEAVLEDCTREALLRHLGDDGAPRAVLGREAVIVDRLEPVQVVRYQLSERRRLGAPRCVDATHRRACIGHARSGPRKRRAYARLGRGPSPIRCARGCCDATSTWRWPGDACC